jgi:serine/threonine-protein kinase
MSLNPSILGLAPPLPNADSSPRVRAVFPGALVAGRYRVERRVAGGGMGEVWEGSHCELRLRVALKTLRLDMLGNNEVLARFSREAFLLGRVQSDHVARVFDFVVDPKLGPVLVTEFVEGPSLATLIESKRMSVEEARGSIGRAIAHRDHDL